MNDQIFYQQDRACPVCERKFTVSRVRTSQCAVTKRDTDFCIYYQDVDPYLYSIWVCPHCGYSAPENLFSNLTSKEKEVITLALKGKEIKVDFSGVRSLEVSIASYKLAIYCCELRECKSSMLAGLYLKAAWLYRKADNFVKEKDYLYKALEYYQKAYDEEPFPIGNLTELTIRYLIGELYRRVGEYKEAIQWFNRVVSDKRSKLEPKIANMAREQWHTAREELAKNPGNHLDEENVLEPVVINKGEDKKKSTASEPQKSKKRLKVSSMLSFYEDQMEWVKKVVANTNGKQIVLNSEAIIRAVLDLVTSIEPAEIKCQTEEELTAYLRQKIKEGKEKEDAN